MFYYTWHFEFVIHKALNIFTLKFKFIEHVNFNLKLAKLLHFYKTKASIVAITCNSKERVHHMIIIYQRNRCVTADISMFIVRTELTFPYRNRLLASVGII